MIENYVKLGDLATYINGYAFKPQDRGDAGLPIIRIQDLTGNSYDKGFYDGEYPSKIEINKSDVLISWSASLGVYLWNGGKALLNQHIFKVDFDKKEIDKNYFIYAVRFSLKKLRQLTHGATMKHIVKRDFENVSIPYPLIKEQKKIAKILKELEEIIEIKQKELSKLDTLIKARFVEMFGDPTINEDNWKSYRLSDKCQIITGNTPSRKVPEYYGSFIEWIKSDNVNTPSMYLTTAVENLSELGKKKGRTVDAGAILMTCIAGSKKVIGNVAIANRKVAFNQQINAIVSHEYNSIFLYVLLRLSKKKIQSELHIALKGILSKSQLSELSFIFPPIELQNEFATFVQQVDKSKVVNNLIMKYIISIDFICSLI